MDADFWHARWASGRIASPPREEVNPYLAEHLDRLASAPGARVLVPLCGKSLDLAFLAGQGHAPVGVELSPVAVAAVFAEQGITPVRQSSGRRSSASAAVASRSGRATSSICRLPSSSAAMRSGTAPR
ncbi:MAG: hypothetical protein U5K43_01665 [Halofilum sp. (in: g-proteobacteria)]|nr:hypothetical protein [Halofilum sp. (in: g-proteobacteria)]